jgi:hypothetical protein
MPFDIVATAPQNSGFGEDNMNERQANKSSYQCKSGNVPCYSYPATPSVHLTVRKQQQLLQQVYNTPDAFGLHTKP